MAADFKWACMVIAMTDDERQSGTESSTLRVKFFLVWGALLAVKLLIAATMPLFGDEAFYAWASLHPAWAYSDLPGGSAALIALGTALAGDTSFGVRLASVALGALIPLLVIRLAKRVGGSADAWRAGLWSLPLPLLLPLGVMALPDALLTVAALAALDACAGLLGREGGARAMVPSEGMLAAQLALALAAGAFAHYRFVPLLLIGALAFFACGGLRRWRSPALWAALAVGALAWVPVLHFNLVTDAAGLRFQFVDRHPWAFHAEGLAQPLLQAIITTPLLYALFAWALLRAWRIGSSPQLRFLVIAGAGLWLFYALLAPFVDRARFSLHWPIPAYLVAAALLPLALRASAPQALARRLVPWTAGMAVVGTLAMLAAFALPSWPALTARTAGTALYPDNFVGWREVGDALRPRLRAGDVLVADHFMLAAQLSFELDRRPQVFVLDHWNNHKHGRAAQIAAWGYDEAGIARLGAGVRAWMAFEVEETSETERAAWVQRLCRWFDDVEPVAVVDGPGGGKRFWLYVGTRRAESTADENCRVALPQG